MSAGTDLERGDLDALAERWAAAWVGQGSFADCCTGDVSYEDPLTKLPLAGPAAVTDHASEAMWCIATISA